MGLGKQRREFQVEGRAHAKALKHDVVKHPWVRKVHTDRMLSVRGGAEVCKGECRTVTEAAAEAAWRQCQEVPVMVGLDYTL